MKEIKEGLITIGTLLFWPALFIGVLWFSSLGNSNSSSHDTPPEIESYEAEQKAEILAEQAEEQELRAEEAKYQTEKTSTTCVDVTSYDYNWDNDMLCTRPDGSKFYTDYAGASRYSR